ncbi:hypothetical protein BH09ACT8_BH09ACT8_37870 [soil metagenome]
MKKSLRPVAVVAAGVAALFSSGVAHASPDVVGHPYSDASSMLGSAGYTSVVSNAFGSQLPWPDCLVTRQQDRTPPDGGGRQTLLTLNCNAPVAAAGVAGNSAASPEGRAAAAAATPVVAKAGIEKSLLGQLAAQGPRPAWVQCSGDLVAKVDSSVDCKALIEQQTQVFTLTVTGDDDGQISYSITEAA